ncbi:MAG: CRISPR-associated protein Cas4 [Thermoanaerobaculia bacterium]
MFSEEELLPLSALQHVVFCERQAALIHLEGLWEDNPLTLEGSHLHEAADSGLREVRGSLRIARGLPLRSQRLGLSGIADVVEFRRTDDPAVGAKLPQTEGLWAPYPIEYKRGRPKPYRADEVQLCAQGTCLEEMLGVPIRRGALFYGKTRRRKEIELDAELRGMTEVAARRIREIIDSRRTPLAHREPKCQRCSLLELCKPDAPWHSAARYLRSATVDRETGGEAI